MPSEVPLPPPIDANNAAATDMPMDSVLTSPETNPTPELTLALDMWEQKISGLEAVAPSLAGTSKYPDSYSDGTNPWFDAKNYLQETEVIDTAQIVRYFDLFRRKAQADAVMTGNDATLNTLISDFIYEIGAKKVAQAYTEEQPTGPLHGQILESLKFKGNNAGTTSHPEIAVLQKAYGLNLAGQLLTLGDSDYETKLKELLANPQILTTITNVDKVFSGERSPSENIEAAQNWMQEVITPAFGLSPNEAYEYTFSASRNQGKFEANIAKVIAAFDHFGADRLRAISKFTGIYGVEGYSIGQLERMENFANQPEVAAAELANHDVAVLLINRAGDHNAILGNVAEKYDDPNAPRTLLFEIRSLGDIYRRMSDLAKRGIKPSTLVLASHSDEGKFTVSDKRKAAVKRYSIASVAGARLVSIFNDSDQAAAEAAKAYPIDDASGVARIVDDYMQPSRGIDDTDADAGRNKIIFEACYLGTELDIKDIDESGNRVTVGRGSFASQLAKSLVNHGVSSKVDIYAAPDGMQSHVSPNGVSFSVYKGNERQLMPAVRIRVQDRQITQDKTDEIVLRKAA